MVAFEFHYAYFIPLWLGIWRWGAYLILKIIPSIFYKAKPISDEIKEGETPVSLDMATMVVPVYQPEPGFIDCLRSWIENKPHKIILAVDVCSYEKVLKIVDDLDYGEIDIKVLNITQPGKRMALYAGLQHVETEIIVFGDDDALYPSNLLRSLIEPFKNPMMGGVGTKQIARPKNDDWDVWDIMMDMSIYQRSIQNKASSFMGGGASCISGRTMAFRTVLFQTEDFREKFLNERFFGALQLSGDDKCLTRMCINSEYEMYHQICKECTLSTQFEKGKKLLQQQLRWARNSWRSDLKLLFIERKVWLKYPWLAFLLIDKIFSPFCMLAGPIIILYYTIIDQNLFAIIGFIAYITISRGIKSIMYFRTRPRRSLKWIFYVPVHILFQYFGAFLRIWALLTLRNRKWGNRSVKVKGNQVVRTGEFKNVKVSPLSDIKIEIPEDVEQNNGSFEEKTPKDVEQNNGSFEEKAPEDVEQNNGSLEEKAPKDVEQNNGSLEEGKLSDNTKELTFWELINKKNDTISTDSQTTLSESRDIEQPDISDMEKTIYLPREEVVAY